MFDLMTELSKAKGGEVISVPPGDYGKIELMDHRVPWCRWPETVTLRAADPADPPVLRGFGLRGVANLAFDSFLFDGADITAAPEYVSPFEIREGGSGALCENLTFRNSLFDGGLAEGVDEFRDGHATGLGLRASKTKGLTVETCEIRRWWKGMAFGGILGLTLRGSEIYGIRSDGINLTGGAGLLIEGNIFRDFIRAPGTGDHADMIQGWGDIVDLMIRHNLFLKGADGGQTQTIFLRDAADEPADAPVASFFQNVTVEDNLIWNSHRHGIRTGPTRGLRVTNNTLLWDRTLNSNEAPFIEVDGKSVDVLVARNVGHRITGPTEWQQDNLIIQRDDPAAPNYVGDLFVGALKDGTATLADLAAKPGSVIYERGLGSSYTRPALAPDPRTIFNEANGHFAAGMEAMGRLEAALAAQRWAP